MLWLWPAVISGTEQAGLGARGQGWSRSRGLRETCPGIHTWGHRTLEASLSFLTPTARVLGEAAPGPSKMMEGLSVSSQPWPW